jgi:hypothetical protein
MLSDALAALGSYGGPDSPGPTAAELAAAELAEGRAALTVRLANALYGSALSHVLYAEVAASDAGVTNRYRKEAWHHATDADGVAILLHYASMRLASDLRAIETRLTHDLGVMGAASEAADAVKLLLEVCTVTQIDDPRAANIANNINRASELLSAAADRLDNLIDATADVATALVRQTRD